MRKKERALGGPTWASNLAAMSRALAQTPSRNACPGAWLSVAYASTDMASACSRKDVP